MPDRLAMTVAEKSALMAEVIDPALPKLARSVGRLIGRGLPPDEREYLLEGLGRELVAQSLQRDRRRLRSTR